MNVFLDLDGTLVDPFDGISRCVAHALRSQNLQVPPLDSLRWVIGPALIESFEKLGTPDPEAALASYRERYSSVGMLEAEPYPGLLDALAKLRAAGHTLYLMTSKPHVFARQITAKFGIAEFLEEQYGTELDGTWNDKADLLAHALQKTGNSAETCVMVGDRIHDILAGQRNSVATVAALWGFGTPDETDRADRQAESIADLPSVISNFQIT